MFSFKFDKYTASLLWPACSWAKKVHLTNCFDELRSRYLLHHVEELSALMTLNCQVVKYSIANSEEPCNRHVLIVELFTAIPESSADKRPTTPEHFTYSRNSFMLVDVLTIHFIVSSLQKARLANERVQQRHEHALRQKQQSMWVSGFSINHESYVYQFVLACNVSQDPNRFRDLTIRFVLLNSGKTFDQFRLSVLQERVVFRSAIRRKTSGAHVLASLKGTMSCFIISFT
jgi:hypothetical protein